MYRKCGALDSELSETSCLRLLVKAVRKRSHAFDVDCRSVNELVGAFLLGGKKREKKRGNIPNTWATSSGLPTIPQVSIPIDY